MRALNADPEIRARRKPTWAKTRKDPEFRARHAAACVEAKRVMMQDPAAVERMREAGRKFGAANAPSMRTPEARHKIRAKQLAWCPEEYWEENRRLKSAGFLLPDRKRIIGEAVATAERQRLDAMTPLERDLERMRNGAALVPTFRTRSRAPEMTLGGVSTGMLS